MVRYENTIETITKVNLVPSEASVAKRTKIKVHTVLVKNDKRNI